jgi:hypothetical protein
MQKTSRHERRESVALHPVLAAVLQIIEPDQGGAYHARAAHTCPKQCGGAPAERPLAERQGTAVQGFGRAIAPLGPVEQCQVVEALIPSR